MAYTFARVGPAPAMNVDDYYWFARNRRYPKMHVLYSFPHRLGKTGVGITAWQHVRWLSELGVRLTVYCGSLERPLPSSVTVKTSIATGKLKIPFRILGPLLSSRIHDICVSTYIRYVDSDINLLHGWPLASEKSFVAASHKGILTVLENCNSHMLNIITLVSDEYELLQLDKKPTHLADRRRLARHNREYGLADYLACPSAFVQQSFIDRGFSQSKLLSTQYGYDNNTVRPGTQDTRDGFEVVFLGRGEPRKGLHYLLSAWKNACLPPYARLLIGGFVEPTYMKLVKPLVEQTSVRFLGYVNDPVELLRNSHVLVLPSVEEGSALVSYEARGAGCVILASTASGAVGQSGEGVLFHRPGDIEALTAQLETLANDPAEYGRIREKSIKLTDMLTWKHAAHVLVEKYVHVLRKGREY